MSQDDRYREDQIERVAKALHKAHYERGRGLPPKWEALDRFDREMWMFSARAAIAAMAAIEREAALTRLAEMDADLIVGEGKKEGE